MSDQVILSPVKFGAWSDAEALRKWSFLQRTPRQRLDWLVQALEIAYRSGALKPLSDGSGAGDGNDRRRAPVPAKNL